MRIYYIDEQNMVKHIEDNLQRYAKYIFSQNNNDDDYDEKDEETKQMMAWDFMIDAFKRVLTVDHAREYARLVELYPAWSDKIGDFLHDLYLIVMKEFYGMIDVNKKAELSEVLNEDTVIEGIVDELDYLMNKDNKAIIKSVEDRRIQEEIKEILRVFQI